MKVRTTINAIRGVMTAKTLWNAFRSGSCAKRRGLLMTWRAEAKDSFQFWVVAIVTGESIKVSAKSPIGVTTPRIFLISPNVKTKFDLQLLLLTILFVCFRSSCWIATRSYLLDTCELTLVSIRIICNSFPRFFNYCCRDRKCTTHRVAGPRNRRFEDFNIEHNLVGEKRANPRRPALSPICAPLIQRFCSGKRHARSWRARYSLQYRGLKTVHGGHCASS